MQELKDQNQASKTSNDQEKPVNQFLMTNHKLENNSYTSISNAEEVNQETGNVAPTDFGYITFFPQNAVNEEDQQNKKSTQPYNQEQDTQTITQNTVNNQTSQQNSNAQKDYKMNNESQQSQQIIQTQRFRPKQKQSSSMLAGALTQRNDQNQQNTQLFKVIPKDKIIFATPQHDQQIDEVSKLNIDTARQISIQQTNKTITSPQQDKQNHKQPQPRIGNQRKEAFARQKTQEQVSIINGNNIALSNQEDDQIMLKVDKDSSMAQNNKVSSSKAYHESKNKSQNLYKNINFKLKMEKQKRNGTVEINTFRSSKYQTIDTTSAISNQGPPSKSNIDTTRQISPIEHKTKEQKNWEEQETELTISQKFTNSSSTPTPEQLVSSTPKGNKHNRKLLVFSPIEYSVQQKVVRNHQQGKQHQTFDDSSEHIKTGSSQNNNGLPLIRDRTPKNLREFGQNNGNSRYSPQRKKKRYGGQTLPDEASQINQQAQRYELDSNSNKQISDISRFDESKLTMVQKSDLSILSNNQEDESKQRQLSHRPQITLNKPQQNVAENQSNGTVGSVSYRNSQRKQRKLNSDQVSKLQQVIDKQQAMDSKNLNKNVYSTLEKQKQPSQHNKHSLQTYNNQLSHDIQHFKTNENTSSIAASAAAPPRRNNNLSLNIDHAPIDGFSSFKHGNPMLMSPRQVVSNNLPNASQPTKAQHFDNLSNGFSEPRFDHRGESISSARHPHSSFVNKTQPVFQQQSARDVFSAAQGQPNLHPMLVKSEQANATAMRGKSTFESDTIEFLNQLQKNVQGRSISIQPRDRQLNQYPVVGQSPRQQAQVSQQPHLQPLAFIQKDQTSYQTDEVQSPTMVLTQRHNSNTRRPVPIIKQQYGKRKNGPMDFQLSPKLPECFLGNSRQKNQAARNNSLLN